MEDGTMKCSCKRCKNLNWLKIDDVRFHLLAKGMLEGYTVWTSHGEKIGRKRSRTSHHRYCVREPSRVEEPVDLNAMLHDLASENYQFYETTDTGTMNVEEAPNDSVKKLYEVIVENGTLSFDPADGEEWKNFDRRYPSFAQEIRNIRLGLATDGFNPFGPTRKKTYSVWPVVIVVYNLPPSMCMKKPYMFMTDIVPGPNSIGKDINVCLRPLIDELKILWNTRVKTYDQSLKQNFIMRAAIMWTISDYPAMSMISGWSGKGKIGCQVCLGSVQGFQLKYYGKCSFYGTNRIFLESNDPLRQKSNLFDNEERRLFRGRLSGEGVKELLDGLVFSPPGKTNLKARSVGYGEEHHWTHEHLVVHLAEEIRLAGPAYWHWMYLIERLLGKLKQKVGNKARVEGSIAERYVEEEILNICSFYFSSDTIHNKVRRNDVLFDVQNSENLEVFKYPIQSLGKEGTRYMSDDERELVEEYVLLNSPEVQPYLRKYQDRVMRQRPETTPQDLDRIVKSRFKTWFKQKVDKDEVEGPHFMDLLEGPVVKVMTFETCQVNGINFQQNLHSVLEDRSNASTSFSLFVDFAQYGQISFIRREEEDEEDDLKDDEDENEGEEEIRYFCFDVDDD
ncbi:uncharacterized protein LOC141696513 [Apium graveolens]|uniref:uncharacterized protein LOC141696513 n=1 Tax=Apium graveolens TaxID=4045 RepID=UPI003D7AA17D